MKKYIILAAAIACVGLTGCTTSQKTTASYGSYPTECISQQVDGKLFLRAYATAEYRRDAEKEAMKRAMDDVIFNGITAGVANRSQVALVVGGNARSKYESYFNQFFADGGDYLQYVSTNANHQRSKTRMKNKGTKTVGILVTVDVPALKARLKQDGII